jgi:hypothetical protein
VALVQGRYHALECLELRNVEDAEAVEVLMQATRSFPALWELVLSYGERYTGGYAGACAVSRTTLKLQLLFLHNFGLDKDGLVALALGNFKALKVLHIEHDGFDEAALVAMGAAGQGRFPKLQEVKLPISIADTPAAKALLRGLSCKRRK